MAYDGDVVRFERLEKLIQIVEPIKPNAYDQNMNFDHYDNPRTNLCAQGHAIRVGMIHNTDFHTAARYFGIPLLTAKRLFGTSSMVNKLAGRAAWRKVTPKVWVQAARRVIAEQKLVSAT